MAGNQTLAGGVTRRDTSPTRLRYPIDSIGRGAAASRDRLFCVGTGRASMHDLDSDAKRCAELRSIAGVCSACRGLASIILTRIFALRPDLLAIEVLMAYGSSGFRRVV